MEEIADWIEPLFEWITEFVDISKIDWIVDLVNRADVQGPDTSLILQDNSYIMWDIWECRDNGCRNFFNRIGWYGSTRTTAALGRTQRMHLEMWEEEMLVWLTW